MVKEQTIFDMAIEQVAIELRLKKVQAMRQVLTRIETANKAIGVQTKNIESWENTIDKIEDCKNIDELMSMKVEVAMFGSDKPIMEYALPLSADISSYYGKVVDNVKFIDPAKGY